jgi:U3 small nucleolar RNA-associated protein 6
MRALLRKADLVCFQDEISSIARRRSDFEHKINSRECQPKDFARYAEFELNVDSLRRKRMNRLKVKISHVIGRDRVALILDRATRRFASDIGLWMLRIEHARRQKTNKKLSQIFTQVLRLHPSKPELWIYAAQFAMEEHGDVTEARSYMQRGLRFCRGSKTLWMEYLKLELLYIAKISARWQILGIEEKAEIHDLDLPPNESDADEIVTAISQKTPVKTSILNGAIPIAVFDAAMKQFGDDEEVANMAFDVVVKFESIPCLSAILSNIMDHMLNVRPTSWRTSACSVKLACAGIPVSSPKFPKCLGVALSRMQEASSEVRNSKAFGESMQAWLGTFRQDDGLDVALHRVISSTLNQLRIAADVAGRNGHDIHSEHEKYITSH